MQHFYDFFWNADSGRVVSSTSGSGQGELYRVHYLNVEPHFYSALRSNIMDVV